MASLQISPIILLTDFGQRDSFAGILKAVIAGISPNTKVIDLTHGVDPRDILQGAFVLSTSYTYFPKGSIFCVVVDPGVGSERKGICIKTTDYTFVGPDNGILWEAAKGDGLKQIIHLNQDRYFLKSVSSTFHGRDVFAPVCAHISKGLEDLTKLGAVLDNCKQLYFPIVQKRGRSLEVSVIGVDRFGNITLNLTETIFKDFLGNKKFVLTINDFEVSQFHQTYDGADENELFLIVSSSAHIEICLKNGSAAQQIKPRSLNVAILKPVTL